MAGGRRHQFGIADADAPADHGIEVPKRAYVVVLPVGDHLQEFLQAVLAHAYTTSRRYEDVIAAADAALEHHPATLDVHPIRIGSYEALGRGGDEQDPVDAIRNIHPRFRVKAFASTQPYVNTVQLERVMDALRSVGLD